MKTWQVTAWSEESSYDEGKPADFYTLVEAATESEADTKGEKKLEKAHGKMAVISSFVVSQKDVVKLPPNQLAEIRADLATPEREPATQRIRLTYFKRSGKYYSEGEYVPPSVYLFDVIREVVQLREMSQLPGITSGKEFTILIETSSFNFGGSFLLVPSVDVAEVISAGVILEGKK